mmetsp:Transcript_5641/g.19748  ORF Transcript_5641/g.19748 Transcript_5641/m.19748 type:complete len:205 (+) Transcript_5641:1220-1834(+)
MKLIRIKHGSNCLGILSHQVEERICRSTADSSLCVSDHRQHGPALAVEMLFHVIHHHQCAQIERQGAESTAVDDPSFVFHCFFVVLVDDVPHPRRFTGGVAVVGSCLHTSFHQRCSMLHEGSDGGDGHLGSFGDPLEPFQVGCIDHAFVDVLRELQFFSELGQLVRRPACHGPLHFFTFFLEVSDHPFPCETSGTEHHHVPRAI